MLNQENQAFRALLRSLNRSGSTCVLAGAGISFESGIPGSAAIINMLRSTDRKRLGETYPEVMAAAFSGPTGPPQRRRFFEGLCAGKVPGSSHFLLALLANSGAS